MSLLMWLKTVVLMVVGVVVVVSRTCLIRPINYFDPCILEISDPLRVCFCEPHFAKRKRFTVGIGSRIHHLPALIMSRSMSMSPGTPSTRTSQATTLMLGQSPPPTPRLRRGQRIPNFDMFMTPEKKNRSGNSGSAPSSTSKTKMTPSSSKYTSSPSTTSPGTKKMVHEATQAMKRMTLVEKTKRTVMKTIVKKKNNTSGKNKTTKSMAVSTTPMKGTPDKSMKRIHQKTMKSIPMKSKPMAAMKKPSVALVTREPDQDLFDRAITYFRCDFEDMCSYNKSFGCPPAEPWPVCFV